MTSTSSAKRPAQTEAAELARIEVCEYAYTYQDLSSLQETIVGMLKRQWALNAQTKGTDWVSQATPTDTLLQYEVAGGEELFEYLNTLHYKWWKKRNGPVRKNDVKFELIDVMHFLLSGWMVSMARRYTLAPDTLFEEMAKSLTDFVWDYHETRMALVAPDTNADKESRSIYYTPGLGNIMNTVKKIICLIFGESPSDHDYMTALYLWLELWVLQGFRFKQVGETYVAKNLLNKFRQSKGYKTGIYKVNWEPNKTDNDMLLEWLDTWVQLPEDSVIEDWMTKTYYECLRKA